MRNGRYGLVLGAALMLVTAVGCGPDANKELADLRAERDRLQGDLNARNDLLTECSNREAAARQQMEDLRRQLAAANNRPPTIVEKQVPGPATGTPAGGWTSMPGFDMIAIAGEVLFDSGKNTLRPAGKTALDKIVSDVKSRYGDRDIYVFGHTDNDPIKKSGWKDNWELGAQRALSVCRHLIGAGIPSRNVIQASAGDQRPRGSNSTASGKQQNRRVEFYAVVRRDGGGGGGNGE